MFGPIWQITRPDPKACTIFGHEKLHRLLYCTKNHLDPALKVIVTSSPTVQTRKVAPILHQLEQENANTVEQQFGRVCLQFAMVRRW